MTRHTANARRKRATRREEHDATTLRIRAELDAALRRLAVLRAQLTPEVRARIKELTTWPGARVDPATYYIRSGPVPGHEEP